MKTIKARFCCLSCGVIYVHKSGPSNCPVCGHLYVKWLNVSEIRPDLAGLYDA